MKKSLKSPLVRHLNWNLFNKKEDENNDNGNNENNNNEDNNDNNRTDSKIKQIIEYVSKERDRETS